MILDLESILHALRAWPPWIAYVVLFGGALVEYVFPPFPGDTVVLAAAALVAVFGWPFVPVFLMVTLGSVAGGMVDYLIGVWLRRTGRLDHLGRKWKAGLDMMMEGFERYGALYLVANRLLPGVRAFFFVAAGVRGFNPLLVAGLALISASLWNALLVGVGFLVGRNLDDLQRVVRQNSIITVVLVVLLLSYVAWRLRKRLREID